MRIRIAAIVLGLVICLTACVTRAEVEEIVGASNESIVLLEQSELYVAEPKLGAEPLTVDPEAISGLVSRIDGFIAKHPDMRPTNDALRVRKAMIQMAAGRMNGARASFAEIEGELLNDRDRALAAIHEPLIWWREVAIIDDDDDVPDREEFEVRFALFEKVIDELDRSSIDVRFYLLEIQAWMVLKLVMPVLLNAEDEILVSVINELMHEALTDYLANFTEKEARQLALLRDLDTADVAALQRLPLDRLRWMLHADILVREYARVAGLVAEVYPSFRVSWPERARPMLPRDGEGR